MGLLFDFFGDAVSNLLVDIAAVAQRFLDAFSVGHLLEVVFVFVHVFLGLGVLGVLAAVAERVNFERLNLFLVGLLVVARLRCGFRLLDLQHLLVFLQTDLAPQLLQVLVCLFKDLHEA